MKTKTQAVCEDQGESDDEAMVMVTDHEIKVNKMMEPPLAI
jgi:hypothetical protein